MDDQNRVLRHRLADRLFHWTTAGCFFVLLATSLLPIFGIDFNWLAAHWIAGLVLIVAVLFHIVTAFRAHHIRYMWVGLKEYLASASHVLAVVSGKYSRTARPGKYSVAQKIFHFAAILVVFIAAGTGIILMIGIDTPFWERDPYFVTESVRGLMFVAHGFATLLSITMIIVHVYFAARPEKRYFLRSMISGWISRRDYEDNHDSELWKEESN
jgi:formate dehydrogenase subunit gamma